MQLELTTSTPELIPLYLPSSLPRDQRPLICVTGLDQIEDRLRFAQACDALVQLRLQLMKHTFAARYRMRNIQSQHSYTRFRALQDHTEKKIKTSQFQYTVARTAVLSLRGSGSWENTLKVLTTNDVRGLGEHALRIEEQEIDCQMQRFAGVDGSNLDWNLEDISLLLSGPVLQTEFIPNLARGEGCRTLSWIWYSTTGEELGNTETEACKSHR